MADQSIDSPPQVSFWRDPRKRAIMFQVFVVALLLAFSYFILHNTLANYEKRGIRAGFGFLSEPAGFGILQSLVSFTETDTYGRTFLVGLLNTVLVSALGIFFATVLGFIIGIARLSQNWLVSRIATVYIEIFRNIPPLLQIVFWYFAIMPLLPEPRASLIAGDFFLNRRGLYMPSPVLENGSGLVLASLVAALIGSYFLVKWAKKRQNETGQVFPVLSASLAMIVLLPLLVYFMSGRPITWDVPELTGFNFQGGWAIIPELAAMVMALSVYTAAFIAEIVRSGIQAVSHGQTEAAMALGIKRSQSLRLVIIPQAMRVIIPQLTSQYLNLTKNSSLSTAVGYPDLVAVFAGTTLNQTGRAVEVISMTMLVYLTLSLVISGFMNWYNARMALVER